MKHIYTKINTKDEGVYLEFTMSDKKLIIIRYNIIPPAKFKGLQAMANHVKSLGENITVKINSNFELKCLQKQLIT